jgi:hypothetical protein
MATLNSGAITACPTLNADAVKEIIDTDLTDPRINAFINMAYHITRPLTNQLDDCGGGDAQCDIMKLLAAHFMTMYERQTKSESVGGEWSVTYLGKEGMGLEASLYGQQALAMDCSGFLKRAGMKRTFMQVVSYEDLEEQEPTAEYLE